MSPEMQRSRKIYSEAWDLFKEHRKAMGWRLALSLTCRDMERRYPNEPQLEHELYWLNEMAQLKEDLWRDER